MNKKIGMITWHYYNNFGSALQAYALQQAIKSLGYDCQIINYRDRKFGNTHFVKIKMMALISKLKIMKQYCFPFIEFQEKYLSQSKVFQDPNRLGNVSKIYDAVVCGSDQIWAPNVFDPVYMLQFVPEQTKKISYAASVGLNDIPEHLIKEYNKLLQRFSSISVREKQGGDLLKEKCSIDSELVLDPTLLIPFDHWEKIEHGISISKNKPFIFCYFLNHEHKYKESVEKYAKQAHVEIIGVSSNQNDGVWMNILPNNIGPREFLWLIHNAEAVFTDSYHGTIFSLIYHKDFVTFERFDASDEICQNSRISQLADYFNIGNRIINIKQTESISIKEVDYFEFERELTKYRELSITFLREALED